MLMLGSIWMATTLCLGEWNVLSLYSIGESVSDFDLFWALSFTTIHDLIKYATLFFPLILLSIKITSRIYIPLVMRAVSALYEGAMRVPRVAL